MNLYKIDQTFATIYSKLEESEGELTPELEAELELAKDTLEQRGEVYCKLVNSLKSTLEEISSESSRLANIKKKTTSTIDKITDVLKKATLSYGYIGVVGNSKLSLGLYKLFTANRRSIRINEPRLLKMAMTLCSVEDEETRRETYDNLNTTYSSDDPCYNGEAFIPYDTFIANTKVKLSINLPLNTYIHLMKLIEQSAREGNPNIEYDTPSVSCGKEYLLDTDQYAPYAEKVVKTSLTIK